MESEQPQSPFAPGFEGVSSAEAQTPPTPDPYQGGEPRLGIVHLLVWTACVAFLLGIDRFFSSSFAPGDRANRILLAFGIQALGAGAGLGGLLLWGWRRYHGQPFPYYPGEYFVVIAGAVSALYVPLKVSLSFMAASAATGDRLYLMTAMAWTCAPGLVAVIAYLVSAIRMKVTRWRVVFLLNLGFVILRRFGVLLSPFPGLAPWIELYLIFLADAIVGIALWLDYRQKSRYPWTHWLGIAIFYWGTVVQLTWMFLR